jgi:Carboxypeptidase regulatory-like domain
MYRNLRRVSYAVICLAVLALAVYAPLAGAQAQTKSAHAPVTFSPSIWGTVTDNHGAPLGGAKVTLLNEKTKESTGGSTDGTGQYHFENLLPGKYTVSFDASGFISKQHQVNLKPGTKKIEVSERLKPPPEPEPKP